MITFNENERSLLEKQKIQEKMCVEKYTNYANQTDDPELKKMFQEHANQEQQHYDTINQLLSGKLPNMNSNQGNQNSSQNNQPQINQQSVESTGINSNVLGTTGNKNYNFCKDLLMTEKYVSGTYDNDIFQFKDTNVRNILNHIQKEEQKHGEQLSNYIEEKGIGYIK